MSVIHVKPQRELDMQTAKQEVSELLARLPENCSLEDIQYHLYVLQKVESGLEDSYHFLNEIVQITTSAQRLQEIAGKFLDRR
jgi:predicted transcriptional regulator of viral defense system